MRMKLTHPAGCGETEVVSPACDRGSHRDLSTRRNLDTSRLTHVRGGSKTATWLVPITHSRCQYVARQIAVKTKYRLWVTAPEAAAMTTILSACPGQPLPAPGPQPTDRADDGCRSGTPRPQHPDRDRGTPVLASTTARARWRKPPVSHRSERHPGVRGEHPSGP